MPANSVTKTPLSRVNISKAFKKRYIEEGNEPYVKKALVKIATEAGVNLRLSYGKCLTAQWLRLAVLRPKVVLIILFGIPITFI